MLYVTNESGVCKMTYDNPRVSVIMPSLNVANYIRECIESVIKQSLNDIEIICVDAGSTDGTWEILQEYARADSRIRLIHSDRKSYGYQMNLGLAAAKGKYIGIVETDDYAAVDMFETLYLAAESHQADFVKSNYYWYTTKPSVQNKPFNNLAKCKKEAVFCPLEDKTIFTVTPSIWSGIYSRQILFENNIQFNETPGASYQDTSFHFMVCTVSKRCYLLDQYFLHYRRDNENSSVNSPGKVFCVSDEMHYYEEFLSKNSEYKACIEPFYMALKYEKYRWNYARLAPQFQWEFLELFYKEFQEAKKHGLLQQELFPPTHWGTLTQILENPIRYFQNSCKIYSTRPTLSTVFPFEILRTASCAKPKVSIIIPVYNYAQYVGETINSLTSQSLHDIEIICVNDGSTDTTLDILLDYASKDSRISVINQINKGQSAARNVGISVAHGQYVYFLDSDDLLEHDALENLVDIAVERNLDVLYFDGTSFFEPPELKQKHPYYLTAYEYNVELPDVLTGKALFCRMKKDKKYRPTACLAIYSRDYLNKQNLRFIEGIYHEDNPFSFACMLNAERVAHITEKYLLRRVHINSTMTSQKSFLHLYGYLTAFLDMQKTALGISYDKETYFFMRNELYSICNLIRGTYRDQKDKKIAVGKLNDVEELYLNEFILMRTNLNILKASSSQDKEAELIRASFSYKIGRCVTWLPRKIRGLSRCYAEHGLSYTLHRIVDHLAGRAR